MRAAAGAEDSDRRWRQEGRGARHSGLPQRDAHLAGESEATSSLSWIRREPTLIAQNLARSLSVGWEKRGPKWSVATFASRKKSKTVAVKKRTIFWSRCFATLGRVAAERGQRSAVGARGESAQLERGGGWKQREASGNAPLWSRLWQNVKQTRQWDFTPRESAPVSTGAACRRGSGPRTRFTARSSGQETQEADPSGPGCAQRSGPGGSRERSAGPRPP
jgi:hypothetical protein